MRIATDAEMVEDSAVERAADSMPRGYALVVADEAGTLHVLTEHSHGSGGPLQSVGSARLERGWPTRADASSAVSASCVLAQEGVPSMLLLGHEDGTISHVALPGGPPSARCCSL